MIFAYELNRLFALAIDLKLPLVNPIGKSMICDRRRHHRHRRLRKGRVFAFAFTASATLN